MFTLRIIGLEQAQARLAAAGRQIVPVLRGALNTTATKSRAERFIKPMAKSIAGKRLRAALKVKRANSRRLESRVIPSSSGVSVLYYKSWGFDPIDKTRARIWVRSPTGRKVAAGFVNPASLNKLPLAAHRIRGGGRAYNYSRGLIPAMGPSTAYWFKQLADAGTVRWTNAFLQQEFESRIRKELAR
jgi:hypothetical protein